jgi:hypothetical protein
MGIFDNFFTSPREREGKNLNNNQMQSYDDLISQIGGMKSGFEGINTTGDVSNKFGVRPFDLGGYKKQVGATFAPSKRNLANRLAQARSEAGARMSSRNATPEAMFNPIEGQYANAFGDLEGQQANAELGGYDKQTEQDRYIAGLLQSVLGSQDTYGLNKTSMKAGAMGGKTNAISNYLQSLSDASTFDDLMSLLGTGAKIYGAATGRR